MMISYGYTNEYFGDSTELLYLRARMYAPGMGRFLTKDTWGGDTNDPISYNKWNYGNSNPIMFTDPTGNTSSCGFAGYFSNAAADYVDTHVNIPKTDWMNTYAAAGVAAQCWSEDLPNQDDYNAYGPAQITNKELSYAYGKVINNPDEKDPEKRFRGFGLLCYIIHTKISIIDIPCTICESEDYMNEHYGEGNYQQEMPHNQNEMKWAVEYMRRRIKLAVDACAEKNCGVTDKYITAALAQDGPSFSKRNFTGDVTKLKDTERLPGVNLDWKTYFDKPGNFTITSKQLARFTNVTLLLAGKGWYVPDINWQWVNVLSEIGN